MGGQTTTMGDAPRSAGSTEPELTCVATRSPRRTCGIRPRAISAVARQWARHRHTQRGPLDVVALPLLCRSPLGDVIAIDPRRDHHPRAPFALHVIRSATTARIVLIGETGPQQVELLHRCLGALAARGATRVLVDMSSVSFLSPAARRALAAIADELPSTEVFLVGLGGAAHRQIAQRHARARIRVPRAWCRRCAPAPRLTLPRRG